ncbi:nuclear factor NF-kappa-B p110 subunit-like isoform X2 [Centruroides vittatus]|uniref:nuclear factor NF-kappa-B p110 subunit-like isoform X2 n=1 Tax=Centruroides vittatus TaxID=120091 RepID=UPI00350F27CD
MARGDPYIRIINQPTNRMRFRYGSEKGSHGALTGKDSSHKRKTFPTVQLENYFGNKTVYVKATLHTNSEPPVQHVHRLRGPDCTDGFCIKKVDKTSIVVFQNLSIEFVGKRELTNIIYERKQKELQFQLCDEVIRDLANEESKRINLHVVRICFEAGIFEDGTQWQSLCKTYSDPIANQKSTDTGELKITRIDKCSGSCKGGDEVFLLCERVNKKDIKIKFFEEKDGESRWEAEADFTDSDVHHQVAIVFKTPPYRNIDINQSVIVAVQLFRPSDNETSKSIQFEYQPALKDTTSYDLSKKKRKTSHTDFEPLSTATSLSPKPVNTTSINYEKEKGNNNEGGERKNIEKSVLTCIELNSEPVFKAFPCWSSNNSVQINTYKKQNSLNSIERVTDFKSVRDKEDPNLQEMLHSINNNLENDYDDISKFLDDICMQDKSPYSFEDTKISKLIDFSRDPLLGSTSSFFNPPMEKKNIICNNNICSDSVTKETVQDSLHDDLSKLSLEETNNPVSQRKENHFHKFTLSILKAFQEFIITGNSLYIFLSMRSLLKQPDHDGNNILHLAMIHQPRNFELLKCVLKVAKTIPNDIVNQVNNYKQTLLHLAIKNDCMPSSVCILLEAGCNPNLKDKDGNTVMHYTVQYDKTECLEELIKFQKKSKMDLNLLNFEGLTPLHTAVKLGRCQQVKLLCSADININATDGTTGRTPLHYAVQFCPALIPVLLNQSEIINDPKDYGGNTPSHLARSRKLGQDIVSMLSSENTLHQTKSDDESEESSFSSDDEKLFDDDLQSNLVEDFKEKAELSSDSNKDVNLDSGYQSREIAFLTNAELEEIGRCLDPPNEGWRALAAFVVDEQFIEIVGKYKSPTKKLLNMFQGDRSAFRNLLIDAGLDTAGRILG